MHHYYSLPSLIISSHVIKKQTNSKVISCTPTTTPSSGSPFTQSRNQVHKLPPGLAGVSDVLPIFSLCLTLLMPTGLVPHTNHLHVNLIQRSSTWKISSIKICLVIPLPLKLLFQLHSLNEVTLFNSIICPLPVQFPYSEVYSWIFFFVCHT